MNKTPLMTAAAVIGAAAVLLAGLSALLSPVGRRNADAERGEMMARLLPGSTSFAPEAYSGGEDIITAVFKGESGWVVETTTNGYAGDLVLLVGVDKAGKVTGVVVRDMEETWGLGGNALREVAFLSQFLHTSGELEIGKNVDVLTGATVTTKAIVKGINAASAFVTGADVGSNATQWEG